MTTAYISTIEAKEEFSELVSRVSHNKERIILTRRGKEVVAIVPMEDFFLIQKSQSKNDLDEAVEALKEYRNQGAITLDDLKTEIG
jgi:prevent-host-death family protein